MGKPQESFLWGEFVEVYKKKHGFSPYPAYPKTDSNEKDNNEWDTEWEFFLAGARVFANFFSKFAEGK